MTTVPMAHGLPQAYADHITDGRPRLSFLENMATHREQLRAGMGSGNLSNVLGHRIYSCGRWMLEDSQPRLHCRVKSPSACHQPVAPH